LGEIQLAFDWHPVDARARAILAPVIERIKNQFPGILVAMYSSFPASVSEHLNLYARFAFEIGAEENDVLLLMLSCSRAISTRPPDVRAASRGSRMNDWIDFVIEDEGGNDFARIETRLLPGNSDHPTAAYEEAIASFLGEVEVFLGEHMNLIVESLEFMRLLKDH
jgi:hypothetical protein